MIFFDTNIWIELLTVYTPVLPHEVRQATAATNLLKNMLKRSEKIVTCKEQLLEIVQAVQKIKLRDFNKLHKATGRAGIGSVKEFRNSDDFRLAHALCRQVCEDIQHFASLDEQFSYSLDDILDHIHLADIHDCMYYGYCVSKGISLYTFDRDMLKLQQQNDGIIYVL